jgi:hypothetical protein
MPSPMKREDRGEIAGRIASSVMVGTEIGHII